MTTERDRRNELAYCREEGMKEGLEKGRQEGLAEGAMAEKQRIAEALKALGVSEDIIAKAIKAGS